MNVWPASDYVWDAPAGAPTLSGALMPWSDSALLLQRDATRQWRIRLTRVESVVIPSGQGSRARSALVLGTVGAAAGPLAVLFYSAADS